MAEVLPLHAVHYDLGKVGSLADVVAPPYDVIDDGQRAELATRSPYNVVELDLPRDPGGGDPYEHAGDLLEQWTDEGVLIRDTEPTIWALEQDYDTPDGSRLTRRGFLARVRLAPYGEGIRPHERTQPGPKEDRLRLTRATRHNLSPIFALHPGDAWRHLAPALGGDPLGEVTDGDGTTHRIWRIDDPAVHAAIADELAPGRAADRRRPPPLRDLSRLPARGGRGRPGRLRPDGPRLAGGSGSHRLPDPPSDLGPRRRPGQAGGLGRGLGTGLRELFDVEEVPTGDLDPAGTEGVGVYGYIDSHLSRGFRLRLRETARLEEALADRSDAYRAPRRGDPRGAGPEGDSRDEHRGHRREARDRIHAQHRRGALAKLDAGDYQAAFLLRPTPVDQVREVAAAGETMPPKSTYFFPKLLTGLVFNPLA